MRIIFMGYHNIGYACLEALIAQARELGDEIVAVVTHADDPQENIWFASVRQLAFENYLPVYQPDNPNDPAFVAAMQALQPHLKLLQEKYKDDRQLLNQKVMEFYRENKVSPFSSCLPLLLQLPVFLGLFYMLRTAGRPDLDPAEWGRWASIFVDPQVGWLWIRDITTFDIGLMFLYIASQFVASWQMARKGAGQQKVISYMMPVVVGIFMYVYKWPAGLFIYWFTSNLWTIAQQFVLEKVVPAPVPVTGAAKGSAAARGSGKASTGPAGKSPSKAGAKTAGRRIVADRKDSR